MGEAANQKGPLQGPWEKLGIYQLLGISENREAGTDVRDNKEAEPADLNEVGGKERVLINRELDSSVSNSTCVFPLKKCRLSTSRSVDK